VRLVASRPDVREPALRLDRQDRPRGLVSLVARLRGQAEEDLLDRAWGLTPTSRLSCQAILSQADVTIELPKYTINHARENH